MRNFFGLLLFCLWAIFARYHYVCKIKNHCDAQPENTTLSLLYEDEILLENYEHFHFNKNSINPNLSENNNLFLNKVASWLSDNPEQKLNIAGVFSLEEADQGRGIYENMGLARAAVVRDLLVRRGIEEARITLDFAEGQGSGLAEPLGFFIYDDDANTNEDLTKLQYSFFDMTYSDANFEYNSDRFTPGSEFKLYADSLRAYLADFPDKSLMIIGHTDSIGSDAFNNELGLRRAISASVYFKNLGLENEIITESKGRNEPIRKNDSEAARMKNRRVNFVID